MCSLFFILITLMWTMKENDEKHLLKMILSLILSWLHQTATSLPEMQTSEPLWATSDWSFVTFCMSVIG